MNGDLFYFTSFFGDWGKATERCLPDDLTRWLITHSNAFTRKVIEKVRGSVRAYIYLVLTSQIEARSNIADNLVPTWILNNLFPGLQKHLQQTCSILSHNITFYNNFSRILEKKLTPYHLLCKKSLLINFQTSTQTALFLKYLVAHLTCYIRLSFSLRKQNLLSNIQSSTHAWFFASPFNRY